MAMFRFSWMIWGCYAVIATLVTLAVSFDFLVAADAKSFYYHTLVAFSPVYWWAYAAAVAQNLFSLIHILPLFFFVSNIRIGWPAVWECLLVFRLIFDIAGHQYEFKELVAAFHSSTLFGILYACSIILFWVPSYSACYLYAFHRKTARST